MLETIYNLYVFLDAQKRVLWLGHIAYEVNGSDEEKITMLRDVAERDFKKAKLTKPPASMTLATYNATARLGRSIDYFQYVFDTASRQDPLTAITMILDGVPTINYRTNFSPTNMKHVNATLGAPGEMEDWLQKYNQSGEFDFAGLINDDYFKPYKLLFNNGHYASATKLFLSCIDSLAYVEFGDASRQSRQPPIFCQWLDQYVDLSPVGVTASELWELRNGLLHMSNLDSEKVQKKSVRRISVAIGDIPANLLSPNDETFYFNLIKLFETVTVGINNWCETYVYDHAKFKIFVQRWDRTISDSRLTLVHLHT